jgi:alkylation response protein AidB-like acyl-CoA dehydrogenase
MPRLAQTAGLTDVQQEILATVKQFVDKEIIPHAQALEHADEYPADIVAGMREMGLFGLTIPEEYGGLGESLLTYALVVEQIARGWMSVSGIINTHFIVAHMIKQHGTPEQKLKFLPKMAAGEVRGSFSMSEPDLGSDVAAIKTRAVRTPDGSAYTVNGAKMWLTNGGSSNLVALLARTDEGAAKSHQNLTAFLVEKPTGFGEVLPGLTIPGKIDKMGYKGVDTTEALFDNVELPADSVLGGQPGRGFAHMMDGIEVGRVNVSARACGIAIRAFELAIGYAQSRKTFGKAIADHQAIAFKLAEMATKVEAAHLMMVNAARLKDSGERNDVAAGMAKLIASEYCAEVTQDAFRIHGGYGYSTEYEIERLMREAPFLLIGEGTSEIQKMIISRGLLREYKILNSMGSNGPARLLSRPLIRPGPFDEDPVQIPGRHRRRADPGPLDDQLDARVVVRQGPPGDHPVLFERVAEHAVIGQHGDAEPLGHHQLAHLGPVGREGDGRRPAPQQPVQVAVHEVARSHHDQRLGQQVGGGHGRPRRKRAVRPQHDHGPPVQQRGVLQIGRQVVAVEVVHQAEVEAALEDAEADLGLLGGDHLDLRLLVGQPELPDGGRQQRHRRGVDRAQAHLPDAPVLLVGRVPEPVERVEQGEDVREELTARVAHPRPVAAPVEQVDPEFPLQAPHRAAQRGLGDVQLGGRPPERAEPGDDGHVLKLLDPHPAASRAPTLRPAAKYQISIALIGKTYHAPADRYWTHCVGRTQAGGDGPPPPSRSWPGGRAVARPSRRRL